MGVDIIGYCGTFFVVASFLCRSMVKLRLLNVIGALLVTIYAVITEAWPVVMLDGFIMLINIVQLVQIYRRKRQNQNYNAIIP